MSPLLSGIVSIFYHKTPNKEKQLKITENTFYKYVLDFSSQSNNAWLHATF